jgi:hypothetical protein
MTDAQIIQRLKNLSTDAILSGDHVTALTLSQAAARITELLMLHRSWHPSFEKATDGI